MNTPVYDEPDNIFSTSAVRMKIAGAIELENRETLAEVLTINGVSLWDVLAPSFAINYLAPRLAREQNGPLNLIGIFVRDNILSCLRVLRDLYKKIIKKRLSECSLNLPLAWNLQNAVMFLCFSEYISKHVINNFSDETINSTDYAYINDQLIKSLLSNKKQDRSALPEIGNKIYRQYLLKRKAVIKHNQKICKVLFADSHFPRRLQKNFLITLLDKYAHKFSIYMDMGTNILANSDTRLIVSTDVNDPRCRIFTLLGKTLNIPTLTMQMISGYGPEAIEWQFLETDLLTVAGKLDYEVFAQHGVPKEKMIITGTPRYSISQKQSVENLSVRERFQIPNTNRLVVFASQPYFFGTFSSQKERDRSIREFIRVAADTPEIHVLIKPHPVENVSHLKRIISEFNSNNISFVGKSESISDLLETADAIATFYSTASIEALRIGLPVLFLYKTGLYPLSRLLGMTDGIADIATTEDELKQYFRSLSNGVIFERNRSRKPAIDCFLSNLELNEKHADSVNNIVRVINQTLKKV